MRPIKTTYKTLYIIGNGFDLHHKLDTWYSSFGLFLKEHHNDIYEVFLEYYGFGDLDEDDEKSLKDPLWWQFEASLAQMDGDLLLDNHSEHIPNYASDDFRDRDRYDIQIYIEDIVNKATLEMRKVFEEFIQNVSYPKLSSEELISIDNQALFLTFNYTDTLERYYKIDRHNIEYIHNKSGEEKELILGHGIDPKEFEKQEEKPPEDPEELERWTEWMSDNYDYSIERGKDEVRSYFQKSFKPTKDVIAQKTDFFNKLNQIEKVYILGHSLSQVDMPYFQEIVKKLKGKKNWFVSYHKESEKEEKKETLSSLGIDKTTISLTKITDI